MTSWITAAHVTGTMFMLRTVSKLFPRSASDWMSPLPIEGLVRWHRTAQPFLVELVDIAPGELVVLTHAGTLRGGQRQHEDEQRPDDDEDRHGGEGYDLDVEGRQHRALEENRVGQCPRQ